MLEVPSNHPSISNVELYLEVIVDPAVFSSPLTNPGSSLKRQRTQEPQEANTCSKPRFVSSLWVDDHELRVGLCFKDRDELKKTVDWCSMRGRQKCVVRETGKDENTFECVRWKCNWSIQAVTRIEEEDGVVEITKCSGPHTCSPIGPDNFNVEFAAEEIESMIRLQPTLTIAELKDWWFEKYGDMPKTSVMHAAKQEVIKKVFGDWDQSFIVLPKLMAALHSSNGLIVDWQYDLFPNPEFASFRSVFWAFPQSVKGFRHCRPLIVVDTKDLNNNGNNYPMKLMIASGLDAYAYYFPVAFAVTKEVSSDTWRWFLSRIKEKVTQRKNICLISSPHPDILDVINEPGSRWQEPWAYHMFCLDHLCSQFHAVFQDDHLKNLVEEDGYASDEDEFDSYMETIKKKNPKAWRWLDQIPPDQWALAHDNGRRYGLMSINNAEYLFGIFLSFESLTLSVTAFALLLFDELRLYFYNGICDASGKLNCGDMYTKAVVEKHEMLMAASVTHVIMPLDKDALQVTELLQKEDDDGLIVKLSECSCTCGEFTNKFPCQHVLTICEKLRINPLKYVDDCYSVEWLYKTFAPTFNPVPKVSAWPEASGVPTLFPPVIPHLTNR